MPTILQSASSAGQFENDMFAAACSMDKMEDCQNQGLLSDPYSSNRQKRTQDTDATAVKLLQSDLHHDARQDADFETQGSRYNQSPTVSKTDCDQEAITYANGTREVSENHYETVDPIYWKSISSSYFFNPLCKHTEKLVVGISILSIVLCAITVGISFAEQASLREYGELSQGGLNQSQKFNVCVTCPLTAKYSPNILRINTYDMGQNMERCCASDKEQLSALVSLIAEPRYRPPSKNFSISGASAHKCLKPSIYFPNLAVPKFLENQNVPLNLSLKLTPTIEHARNVGVTTSGLELEHDGMYYVYSMVNFKPDSSQPCGRYERQIWEQNVIRTRPNFPELSGVILTGHYTCADESRDSVSNFISGTFYLHHGDKLSVEVSAYGLTNFHIGSSYIGLWMTGHSDGDAASSAASTTPGSSHTKSSSVTEVTTVGGGNSRTVGE